MSSSSRVRRGPVRFSEVSDLKVIPEWSGVRVLLLIINSAKRCALFVYLRSVCLFA